MISKVLSPRLTLLIDTRPSPSIRLMRDGALYEAVAVRQTQKKVYDLERMNPEKRALLEYVCIERRVARAGRGNMRTGIAGGPEWVAAVAELVVAAAQWKVDNALHKEFVEPPEEEDERGPCAPTSSALMYLTILPHSRSDAKLIGETSLDDGRVVLRIRSEMAWCCGIHGVDEVEHTRVGHVRMVFARVA